jgi:hypothetical protein
MNATKENQAYKLIKSQFGGIPRSPKSNKYFISTCKDKLRDNENYIKIIKEIKEIQSIRDIDLQKSQLLEASMDSINVIIKIGDSSEIENEYNMSLQLKKYKGFVKFLCYFTCQDNFLEFFEKKRKTICKNWENGNMKVIIMPYFPLGSVASYKWTIGNIKILHSSLYIACISYIDAYNEKGFVHGDFHAGNILLKKTTQKTILVETHGIRPWICDFEKSYICKKSKNSDADFIYDLQKLFFLLPTMISNISKSNIMNIPQFINNNYNNLKTEEFFNIISEIIQIAQ